MEAFCVSFAGVACVAGGVGMVGAEVAGSAGGLAGAAGAFAVGAAFEVADDETGEAAATGAELGLLTGAEALGEPVAEVELDVAGAAAGSEVVVVVGVGVGVDAGEEVVGVTALGALDEEAGAVEAAVEAGAEVSVWVVGEFEDGVDEGAAEV